MREILFRGLRTDGKGWAYGNLIKYRGHQQEFTTAIQVLNNNKEVECVVNVIDNTVGQFTGRYGTCGNKVFEGDIVNGTIKNKTIKTSGVINMIKASFCVCALSKNNDGKTYFWRLSNFKGFTITSNIHES